MPPWTWWTPEAGSACGSVSHGLLRPLSQAELSDGTLRYLLWIAALLTPRPPSLMVLNEPETSLHPDLLPALGRLMKRCAQNTQLWVTTHAESLIQALTDTDGCNHLQLGKELGETLALELRTVRLAPLGVGRGADRCRTPFLPISCRKPGPATWWSRIRTQLDVTFPELAGTPHRRELGRA